MYFIISFVLPLAFLIAVRMKTLHGSLPKLPLPPGPKRWPILGNLLEMPVLWQWLTYSQWSKTYGDVLYLRALGADIVVLDSLEAVTDLFDRRSSIYSGRPRMPMLLELMDWGWASSLMEYGPYWRKHRRAFHQYFHMRASDAFHDVQLQETRKFVRRLIDSPNDFRHHINLLMAAIILRIAYGVQIEDSSDPYIRLAAEAMEGPAETGIPGTFLVDVFPILKYVPSWFPGAQFKIKAERWRQAAQNFINVPFNEVKANLNAGKDIPCLVTNLLHRARASSGLIEEEETVAKNLAGICFAGGSDTATSSLAVFFAVMALNRGIQRRAQEEIDAVVDANAMPDFTTRQDLPYVQAIVKEILRWQLVTPLALPHKAMRDDEYKGYRIPKGASIFGNSWSILHSERYYSEPMTFKPERFLDTNGQLDPTVLEPSRIAFGFGRRQCPGRHLAMNTLFIAFASVLRCFTIKLAEDGNGKLIPINVKMSPGMISFPEQFRCSIVPRFERVPQMIQVSLGPETAQSDDSE